MTTLELTAEQKQKLEQKEWDLQCYGCTSQALRTSLIGSDKDECIIIVAGMMSDAQEELERDLNEQARQTLNRAKFVLFNYVMKEGE